MRNSSWMDWFGAEVGFSIYIHRRGFTSSSTINHHLLARANERGNALHRESETGHPPHEDGPLASYPTAEPHNPLGRSAATTRHWAVVVPLYPHSFDQASCQTRLGFSPKGGNRRPDPWNSFRLLQNAVSVGSGGGVAGALAAFRQPARPGPLYRWRPGTLPRPALPGDASPQVRSLPQERLLEMLPPQAGCLRARSAWPRSP